MTPGTLSDEADAPTTMRSRRTAAGRRRPPDWHSRQGSRRLKAPVSLSTLARLYDRGWSAGQLADRFTADPRTVRRWLVDAGVTIRTRKPRPPRQQPDIAQLRHWYVEQLWSLRRLATELDSTEETAARLLDSAGIARRGRGEASRRPPKIADQELRAWVAAGWSDVRIARTESVNSGTVASYRRRLALAPGRPASVPLDVKGLSIGYRDGASLAVLARETGCSPSRIRGVLRDAGVTLRSSRGRQQSGRDAGELHQWYVDERLSISDIARRLNVEPSTVRRRLQRAGVAVRSRAEQAGWQPLTPDVLHAQYVVARRSAGEIAKLYGGPPARVLRALRSAGIDVRPPARQRRHWDLDVELLRQLYLEEQLGDTEIAARLGLAPYRVRVSLREHDIRRPWPRPDGPATEELVRLYETEQWTLSRLATQYKVPVARVRRWLTRRNIPLRAPARASSTAVPLDADEVRRLYVEDDWTAAEIGARVGVDGKLVLDLLHHHGVPVRGPGPRHTAGRKRLLGALYADPAVVAALRAHRVPIRRKPGNVRERFPTPVALTSSLAASLYNDLGLSLEAIRLLTGQTTGGVRDSLTAAGIELRAPGPRSPWARNR